MDINNKNLDTLVDDVYKLVDNLHGERSITEDLAPHLDEFTANIREAVEHWSTIQTKGGLRMSNLGRPDRQLYFDLHGSPEAPKDKEPAHLQINFLYGHLLEQVVLLLVKAAGHHVDSEQAAVEVDGIKGSMDSRINGEVIDIKSASPFSFKKFVSGRLAEDDPFGYMAQLAGYEADRPEYTNGGFLVINKVNGELCLFRPEDLDKPNIHTRIEEAKKLEGLKELPDFCYETVPQGKSGNMMLPKGCAFCKHKRECYKDANEGKGLRVFKYAYGLEYLTHVEKMPKVLEVT
jgi:hypothetical protein